MTTTKTIEKKKKELKTVVKKEKKESKESEDPKISKDKASVMNDVNKKLKRIKELMKMTNTPAWKAFYKRLTDSVRKNEEGLVHLEKNREIIKAQEGVKIINQIIEDVQRPINDLNSLFDNHPLFTPAQQWEASFDKKTGTVDLKEPTEK